MKHMLKQAAFLARKPYSTIGPLLTEGDDLLSAQAIHYGTELSDMANFAKREGLIAEDDPALCAEAVSRNASIGAARPRLAEEVHTHLKKIRNVEPVAAAQLFGILSAIETRLAPGLGKPCTPDLAADLARHLERAMFFMSGPRILLEETAVLVARLSDTAVLSMRHAKFNGFCSELTIVSRRPDMREVARGLTRDGTLPQDDPRCLLSDASLLRDNQADIAPFIASVLFTINDVQYQLGPCGVKPFAPARLRRLISKTHRAMSRGFDLEGQRELDFLQVLASTVEGLGMNLHHRGDPQHHELTDRLLSFSTLLVTRAHAISYRLRCEAAGLTPWKDG